MKLGENGANNKYRYMPNVKNQVFRIRIIDELLRKQEWVTTQKMQRDIIHRLGYSVTLRTMHQLSLIKLVMRTDTLIMPTQLIVSHFVMKRLQRFNFTRNVCRLLVGINYSIRFHLV
jgi:RIO-like serine/threonine protein kinase